MSNLVIRIFAKFCNFSIKIIDIFPKLHYSENTKFLTNFSFFWRCYMEDIKTRPKTVQSLVNDINKKKYNFDLPIQRRAGIWNRKETSLFVDSILRLYPIYPAPQHNAMRAINASYLKVIICKASFLKHRHNSPSV